jgi:hypothetical protein
VPVGVTVTVSDNSDRAPLPAASKKRQRPQSLAQLSEGLPH